MFQYLRVLIVSFQKPYPRQPGMGPRKHVPIVIEGRATPRMREPRRTRVPSDIDRSTIVSDSARATHVIEPRPVPTAPEPIESVPAPPGFDLPLEEDSRPPPFAPPPSYAPPSYDDLADPKKE